MSVGDYIPRDVKGFGRQEIVNSVAPFNVVTDVERYMTLRLARDPGRAIASNVAWLLNAYSPSLMGTASPGDDYSSEELQKYEAMDKVPLQVLLQFMGMSGLMVMVKEVFSNKNGKSNVEYLKKRWTTYCNSAGIEDNIVVLEDKMPALVRCLELFQDWIKPRIKLRHFLLSWVLDGRTPSDIQPLMEQVKMVWHEYGLKSVLIMEKVVRDGYKVCYLRSVAQDAVKLLDALKLCRDTHGANFPYVKIYPLSHSEDLNHRNYPDLYYASNEIARKQGLLGKEGQYITSDIPTSTPKDVISELIKTGICKKRLYEEVDDIEILRKLGLPPRKPPVKKRRREDVSSETDEDMD